MLIVNARGKNKTIIVPCSLNYIHRHRFRSQLLIESGAPMEINQAILNHFQRDEQDAVTALTDKLTEALQAVTLNALN